MNVTLLCTDPRHPVRPRLEAWAAGRSDAAVRIVGRADEATGGDILVLVSCTEIVGAAVRARYRHTLVLHASDLPRGRGWSPHIWSVLGGEDGFVVSLIEASDKVDRGRIWQQRRVALRGDELYDEINDGLFEAECALLDFAVSHADTVRPRAQDEAAATYLPRRTPDDSRLDPDRSLRDQFDLLRVCDPARFPAFFDLRGERYEVIVRKAGRR